MGDGTPAQQLQGEPGTTRLQDPVVFVCLLRFYQHVLFHVLIYHVKCHFELSHEDFSSLPHLIGLSLSLANKSSARL